MKANQAMKHTIFVVIALFWSSCGFGAGVPSIHIPAQDSSVKVKLTSSMSTTSSKPGDQRVRYDGGEVIGYGVHTAVNEGSEIVLSIWKK